jgi:hypothetical protein
MHLGRDHSKARREYSPSPNEVARTDPHYDKAERSLPIISLERTKRKEGQKGKEGRTVFYLQHGISRHLLAIQHLGDSLYPLPIYPPRSHRRWSSSRVSERGRIRRQLLSSRRSGDAGRYGLGCRARREGRCSKLE